MLQCPELVAEFLQCGEGTKYDVFQLLVALYLDLESKPSTHGEMTAVIRYHTTFFVNNKDLLILSFALDNDIPLRSVLGLLTLLFMCDTLNLTLNKLICSELNFTFPLLLYPPGKGLPDGVSLPASDLCVPPSVPFNLTSLVIYTAMDGFTHPTPNHANHSDNIFVQDSFCHDSTFRDLSFALSSKN